MSCKMCEKRGKTWNGDDPKCGFVDGVFTPDNWNCATLNALWEKAEDKGNRERRDDSSFAFVSVPELKETEAGFIALSKYKERGCTSLAVFFSDNVQLPVTIEMAEAAVLS